MKLQPTSLAMASGLAFAIIWVLCSALVAALPGIGDTAYRGMMHAGADMPGMHVSVSGFLAGLVGWTLSAAITGWVLAVAYNTMSGDKPDA